MTAGGDDTTRSGAERAQAMAAVEAWFAAQPDLRVERQGEHAWFTQFAGEHKKTIPVHLEVSEQQLLVQSFFMRAPDENEAALYAYLLRRGLRAYVLRFGLSDDGDVLLVGVLPHLAVTVAELDRVLGQLLATADEAFDVALRLGFAAYIEREQAWRRSVGAPPNPIT